MKLNKDIIEKVRNRKVCLKNDGTVEQLREVIKVIFPHNCHVPSDLYDYCAASRYIDDKWVFYTKPPTNTVISIKSLFDETLKVEDKNIIGYIAPYDINTAIIKNDILVKSKIKHLYVVKGREGRGSRYYLNKRIVETWEAIYKEDFKIGDWVVVKSFRQCGEGNAVETDNLITKLCHKNTPNATGLLEGDFCVKNSRGQMCLIRTSHIMRKATQEEVEEITTKLPKINGYEGNLKNNKLTYGCAHLSKKWFNSSDNRHIKSMELSSGVEINEEQMNQIRKHLNYEK